MAGADGRQLPPLRDLSRRAASFLRMARLALTGAAAPAQLLAGEETVGGHSCDPYYKSIRTEDDWESELWPEEEDDDESELLVDDDDEDGASRTTGGGGGGGALMSKKAAGAAAPVEVEPLSSEPLMPRRAAKRVNDAAVVDHPFGCERRGRSESSSLLLVSS
ncbi:hypothetical protein U9M48_037124 [Paspalum notatum var. saurae]|uniref:Uncharacterized protein n=1 Tax=Paspalum notatum var. saurae TaxID=547442 RepID=A0AAQ3XA98_PASNO